MQTRRKSDSAIAQIVISTLWAFALATAALAERASCTFGVGKALAQMLPRQCSQPKMLPELSMLMHSAYNIELHLTGNIGLLSEAREWA